ncbi:MAG: CinA family nicotinamide mononucleotide deamidase-related protein [Syntrophobacteraceae bacterium]
MNETAEVVGSLLTIGDELLLGDIPNGNAHHIAFQLRCRGFRLDRMLTVGDREEEIVPILLECLERSHFIIVTGGLGPTDDDRTCEAVAQAFDRPMTTNVGYSEWLRKHLAEYGIDWSEEAARMARLPEGAVKLGLEMAGFLLEHRRVPCYFLPGVPHEMRKLLTQTVIPDLEERFPRRSVYVKHVLRVQGIYEPEINTRLRNCRFDLLGVEVGYLPQLNENWITLFAAAESEEEARNRIRQAEEIVVSCIGPEHISGCNDEALEVVVGRMLLAKGWRLALAESCTGGLIAERITTVAGASGYFDRGFVTYSNEAKTELLDVPVEMLEAHGAVSEPVAAAMAEGARRRAGVDVAVAVTGIAGPSGGSEEKPVGTVFIGCATPRTTVVEKHLFSGSRDHIRESAAQAALVLLWRVLSHDTELLSD